MFSKVLVFACLAAFAASRPDITTWPGLGLGGGFGSIWNSDITTGRGLNTWGLTDIEDQVVLKDLIRLDVVNRPLVKRLLELDIVDRKIVGELARGINHVIIKKGTMYPLTLWDRILKIKGVNTGFGTVGVLNRNIENHWIETEVEDKVILEDLIKVDTIDRHIVTSLLWLDVVDRKIVADLCEVINHIVLKKGPAYTLVLLKQLLQINSGSAITTPYYSNTVLGQTDCLWCHRGWGFNPIVNNWRGGVNFRGIY